MNDNTNTTPIVAAAASSSSTSVTPGTKPRVATPPVAMPTTTMPTKCEYGTPVRIDPSKLSPEEKDKARRYAMKAGIDKYSPNNRPHPSNRIYNLHGHSCFFRCHDGSEFVRLAYSPTEKRIRIS